MVSSELDDDEELDGLELLDDDELLEELEDDELDDELSDSSEKSLCQRYCLRPASCSVMMSP